MYGKRDDNHSEIREALRAVGCLVFDAGDVGGDFPDLVAGGLNRKTMQPMIALIEVKTPTGKVRPGQRAFIREWQREGLPVFVVRSVDDALAVFGCG